MMDDADMHVRASCVVCVFSLVALSTMVVGVGVDANVVCGKLTADMRGALLCVQSMMTF
jgi:hypothetical protein